MYFNACDQYEINATELASNIPPKMRTYKNTTSWMNSDNIVTY